MNNYLIPANTKKGQLIFNLFRWQDLVVLLIGGFITLMAIIILNDADTLLSMVLKILPMGIAVLLVMPVAYYHNVLVFLTEMIKYFTSQNVYRWKGWCATDGGEQE